MVEEPKPVYEPIPKLGADQIKDCIARDDPDELLVAVLSAALYEDHDFAENTCIKLARHDNFNIRGNALLGFAHIARIDGKLSEPDVRPLLEMGLVDPNEYVRDQAKDAKDDIEHFLGWKF